MKQLILLLLSAVLVGCATTSAKFTDPDTGVEVEWSSKTLGKDINDVRAGLGDFHFSLGSSESAANSTLIACILAPHLCKDQ